MKINKSSKECAEYNLRNKAEIDLGLTEAQEPTEQIVLQEERARKQEEAGIKLAQDKLSLLKQIDPNATERTVCGVTVSIEQITTGSYSYAHTGWKIVLGDYNNRKWCKIGDGKQLGLSAKQLAKIKDILSTLTEIAQNKARQEEAKKAMVQRYILWRNSPGGKELTDAISGGRGGDTYLPIGMSISEDGMVHWQGETFSIAGWENIVALRKEQCAAMNALKASLKPTETN